MINKQINKLLKILEIGLLDYWFISDEGGLWK